MNNSYTIKDLIQLFLSKIWLIIIVTVLGGVCGIIISEFILPLEYSSHISMYVQSYTDIKDSDNPNYNDISKSKQLINTYIEVLKDDAVMDSVGAKLQNDFDEKVISNNFSLTTEGKIKSESLRDTLSITTVTDTSALTIVATTQNAELSAAICNELAAQANTFTDSAIGIGSIKYINSAKVYSNPVAPSVPKFSVLGAAAGFMLIILIVLMIDFFDDTIKDTSSLEKKYNATIIGQVEQVVLFDANGKKIKKKSNKKHNKNESSTEKHYKLTDDGIPFYFRESFKSIRTNVTFSLAASDKKKIFAVTSANPSEGKSTISSNLAIAFAESGKKVLVIDADMRKNVQDEIFKISGKIGLSTAIVDMSENLTDDFNLDKYIQEVTLKTNVKVENDEGKQVNEEAEVKLHVMPSGKVPPNPSELLGSEQMGKILEKLAPMFDVIIIDTPPVNGLSDSMEIAEYISGIVLVARCNQTTEDSMDAAMKQVELSKMHLLGFVLNDVNTGHHGRYYYKYKRGGDYYKYSYQQH